MDLQKIKRNIESGLIRTTAEFQRDIMLMFLNATMYNTRDHNVYHMAYQMMKDAVSTIEVSYLVPWPGTEGYCINPSQHISSLSLFISLLPLSLHSFCFVHACYPSSLSPSFLCYGVYQAWSNAFCSLFSMVLPLSLLTFMLVVAPLCLILHNLLRFGVPLDPN